MTSRKMALALFTGRFVKSECEYVLVYGFNSAESELAEVTAAIEADMELRTGRGRSDSGAFDRGIEQETLTERERKRFMKRAVRVDSCRPFEVFLMVILGEKAEPSDPRYIMRVGSSCRGYAKRKILSG
jgi:hypothetical protein